MNTSAQTMLAGLLAALLMGTTAQAATANPTETSLLARSPKGETHQHRTPEACRGASSAGYTESQGHRQGDHGGGQSAKQVTAQIVGADSVEHRRGRRHSIV